MRARILVWQILLQMSSRIRFGRQFLIHGRKSTPAGRIACPSIKVAPSLIPLPTQHELVVLKYNALISKNIQGSTLASAITNYLEVPFAIWWSTILEPTGWSHWRYPSGRWTTNLDQKVSFHGPLSLASNYRYMSITKSLNTAQRLTNVQISLYRWAKR